MANRRRGTSTRIDDDGVRITGTDGSRRDVWVVVCLGALAIVVMAGLRLAANSPRGPEPGGSAAERAGRASSGEAATGTPSAPASAAAPRSLGRPRSLQPRARAAATRLPKEDPIPFTYTPGEKSGIAVFPPPGTDPVRGGIVVPEDFDLPPGYVRHYQATDDGQRMPAILMFSPDYEWVDEHGNPVPLPEDRIVPPEMAPPGMPIEMLAVPPGGGAADLTR